MRHELPRSKFPKTVLTLSLLLAFLSTMTDTLDAQSAVQDIAVGCGPMVARLPKDPKIPKVSKRPTEERGIQQIDKERDSSQVDPEEQIRSSIKELFGLSDLPPMDQAQERLEFEKYNTLRLQWAQTMFQVPTWSQAKEKLLADIAEGRIPNLKSHYQEVWRFLDEFEAHAHRVQLSEQDSTFFTSMPEATRAPWLGFLQSHWKYIVPVFTPLSKSLIEMEYEDEARVNAIRHATTRFQLQRDFLLRSNFRLAVSRALEHFMEAHGIRDLETEEADHLIGIAINDVGRALDYFDPRKKIKFSTVVTRMIKNSFRDDNKREKRQQRNRQGPGSKFDSDDDEAPADAHLQRLAVPEGPTTYRDDQEWNTEQVLAILNLAGLNDNEKYAITAFYGIGKPRETIDETRAKLKNSAGRRIIEIRKTAERKLRKYFEERDIALEDFRIER